MNVQRYHASPDIVIEFDDVRLLSMSLKLESFPDERREVFEKRWVINRDDHLSIKHRGRVVIEITRVSLSQPVKQNKEEEEPREPKSDKRSEEYHHSPCQANLSPIGVDL